MNDQQFEMMMQMHRDTHDKIDNVIDVVRDANEALKTHVVEDELVHRVVERHTTYWKLFTGGVTSALTYFGVTK